jgi:hypothetical protein
MERIEVGDAIHAQDHRLAVEHEALLPDLAGGLDYPGIAAGPVIAVPGEQAHPIAVPLYAEAITVVLHFMEPIGAAGNCRGLGRQAKLEGTSHVGKIGRHLVPKKSGWTTALI